MKGPHPSLRLDRLAALQVEEQQRQQELTALRAEERRLKRQLAKAIEQIDYYERYLSEEARRARGSRKGLSTLLNRLE